MDVYYRDHHCGPHVAVMVQSGFAPLSRGASGMGRSCRAPVRGSCDAKKCILLLLMLVLVSAAQQLIMMSMSKCRT